MLMGNFYGIIKMWCAIQKEKPEINLKLTGFTWIDDGKIEIREVDVKTSKRFKMILAKK